MEPQLPVARALAIAGHLGAGGVGVHETALAPPEVVDLRGRCVLPGFTDSHTHFPTWSMAQREVRLEGCATKDEAGARVRAPGERAPPGEGGRGTRRGPGARAPPAGATPAGPPPGPGGKPPPPAGGAHPPPLPP